MRVLVVTNMYPSEQKPAFGVFVHEQVESLRRKGLAVDVLFVDGQESRQNYWRGFSQVRRKVQSGAYDLIHAHYVFSGIMARAQWRVPVVVSFHGAGEMFGWVGTLCKRLAPFLDGFTVTSREHAGQLDRAGARIVPNGIDMELLKPMPAAQAREALSFSPDAPLVLFAADLRPEKRLDVARAAMDLLRQRIPDVELVVVTGRPHSDVPLFMNACNALVLTSDAEGSPQVVKEAMACNLPIVSVDVGDVAEVIQGVEGCYLAEQTPDDIADKLELALRRGERTHGREAVEHLGLDRTADRIIEMYEDALAGRRRPAGTWGSAC
jgi:teichuronic acid biosynthesis glycosyltransferase TuaC